MKIKTYFLILFFAFALKFGFAQLRFGPVIDMGYSAYATKGDSITLKGGISPAFGITAEKYASYWLSMRATALYSFKSLATTRVNNNVKDNMNGQFFDVCLAGRFSNFDDESNKLPYAIAGLGAAFNIVSKGQEKYMRGITYNTTLPYFTLGAGMGFKMSFFSEIDLSLNFSRYLSPAFTIPIDNKDAKLNHFSLRLTGLF